MIVTSGDIKDAATENGGYTVRQIKHAQTLFPDKWKKSLTGAHVTDEWWNSFIAKGNKSKSKKALSKPIAINKMSNNTKTDWSWKPEKSDIPALKISNRSKGNKNSRRKRKKKQAVTKYDNVNFYKSHDWLAIRVRVLEKYECSCMMCGRSPKIHGIAIHVDHIKPRSKFPELSLDIENLQLLCDECNMGKSNKYQTDWRPDESIQEALDRQILFSGDYHL